MRVALADLAEEDGPSIAGEPGVPCLSLCDLQNRESKLQARQSRRLSKAVDRKVCMPEMSRHANPAESVFLNWKRLTEDFGGVKRLRGADWRNLALRRLAMRVADHRDVSGCQRRQENQHAHGG